MFKVVRKEREYELIRKECLENEFLSWESKGLWAYLITRPINFKFSVKELCKQFHCNESDIRELLYKLCEYQFGFWDGEGNFYVSSGSVD